jgi:capsid protein
MRRQQCGKTRSPSYSKVWTPPKWQWVDPLKDVQAARLERLAGMTSLSEQIREKGNDPDAVFDEIERENETLAKKKIVIDTDASHKIAMSSAGSEPAGATSDDMATTPTPRPKTDPQHTDPPDAPHGTPGFCTGETP